MKTKVKANDKPPYVVGLKWDHFTSAVKAQVVKDLIALMDDPRMRNLAAYYETDDPQIDMLIRSVGVERCELAAPVRAWVLYQTGNDDLGIENEVDIPVVTRDLRINVKDPAILDTEEQSGFYLAPQGRNIVPQLDINRPMPAHQPAGTNPMIVWLWG